MKNRLRIEIPETQNGPKTRYVIEVLFGVFLEVAYDLQISDSPNFIITTDNRRLFVSSDFCLFSRDDIKIEELPIEVNQKIIEIGGNSFDIISVFGKSELEIIGDDFFLHSDIFASVFYMLTRWEEKVNPASDEHNRFPATESLAHKHDFLHRPIVNEYVELLWAILLEMGCKQKRRERTYKLVPTHDVDKPYLFNGFWKSMRAMAGCVKRGRFLELTRFIGHALNQNDPFDTFDLMMDLSEKNNVKSHFFFLQKGDAKQDENHEIDTPRIKKLIQHIQGRGHHIGYHPSYNAYDNEALYSKEKEELERVARQKIISGRHHFLRWDVSSSPKLWETNNMEWDSTLGYADHAGFRCGVCYPFPLFDLKNNKQLDVFERPLIAMEWSLIKYQGLSVEQSEEKIRELKDQVKKYGGEFVFLYHNSAFFTDDYHGKSDRILNSFYE